MAELVFKIESGAGYDDGDCLEAFNDRRIQCCHAQRLCHVRLAGFNTDGLRPTASLAESFLEFTSEYRLDRVGPRTLKRTRLADGHEEILGDPIFRIHVPPALSLDIQAPNARQATRQYEQQTGVPVPAGAYSLVSAEQIDVPEFLRRRREHQHHAIFGREGRECWYGGRPDFSPQKIQQVWNVIEANTPHRRTDPAFQLWPAGRQDVRVHLLVRVADFDDTEAARLVEPERNAQQQIMRRRVRHCRWQDDLMPTLSQFGITAGQVRDRSFPIDVRAAMQPASAPMLVREKLGGA